MARRVLVTGAAGVIGLELTRRLLAHGHAVVCADSGAKWGLEDLSALVAAHPGRARLLEVGEAALAPDVHAGDLVAAREQRPHELEPDHARAAGDEVPHGGAQRREGCSTALG